MAIQAKDIHPRVTVPEAHYQCEGADSFAPDKIAEVHFRETQAGYRKASDLFYAELKDPETIWSGFYCEDCLSRFNLKTSKRPSLKQYIEYSTVAETNTLHRNILKRAGVA